jgi:hypothetical protein
LVKKLEMHKIDTSSVSVARAPDCSRSVNSRWSSPEQVERAMRFVGRISPSAEMI